MAPTHDGRESWRRRLGDTFARQVPAWLLVIVIVVAVITTVGWWSSLRPQAPVWGDVATWVGSAATTAGLLFAGMQVREARLAAERGRLQEIDRESEMERALANTVSLRVDPNSIGHRRTLNVTVTNAGQFPVGNISVYAISNRSRDGLYRRVSEPFRLGVLGPGDSEPGNVDILPEEAMDPCAELTFTDSRGQSWRRVLDESGLSLVGLSAESREGAKSETES